MIVRSIQPGDNAAIAAIIRTVMPEFGASGQGFAIHDKEVDDMFASYTQPRTAYFVCELALVGVLHQQGIRCYKSYPSTRVTLLFQFTQ
jgi:hypothetical protein